MKIVLTGSHFTPAQAVIEELKKSSVEIIYLGRKYTREGDDSLSVESEILPKLGVKFIPLITGRLQRSFTIYTIPSLLKIPIGFLQAFYLILKEQPDVVLSFGGYVAVPVVISAWLLSIPIIIHEQTLVSGLANTVSAYFASKIAVSFKKPDLFWGKKTILTGNPMRHEILKTSGNLAWDYKNIIQLAQKEKLPLILIIGGNQGSHLINENIFEVLDKLTQMCYLIHQTGDSKFKDFEQALLKQKQLKYPQRYLVKKWIEGKDLGVIFRKTDLVLSRAGMNTLLELAYLQIPTLVVPIPYLYKDEQNINAQFFAKLNLVKTLPQNNLTPQKLLASLKDILENLDVLKKEAGKAKSVIIPDAAQRLVLETLILAKTSNS